MPYVQALLGVMVVEIREVDGILCEMYLSQSAVSHINKEVSEYFKGPNLCPKGNVPPV